MIRDTAKLKSGTFVDPITHAILIFAGVAVTGLMLGSVRIRGIGIGPAGVLFAGILFGHFGASVDHEIAAFAKEFGLILFVFTIGLQLGPGIIQLWRKQGWLLNGLALAIVAQGFTSRLGPAMGVWPFRLCDRGDFQRCNDKHAITRGRATSCDGSRVHESE